MTVEQSVLVAVPRSDEVEGLVRDIVSAAARANKADPGDRTDVVRYETLCVQLELLAEQALTDGAEHLAAVEIPDTKGLCFDDEIVRNDPHRLARRLQPPWSETVERWSAHLTVVELRRATRLGQTPSAEASDGPAAVATVWRFTGDGPPSEAVRQRLASQLEGVIAARASSGVSRDHSFNPSGVNNRVLAETLRTFAIGDSESRVDAPVTYRDGSQASNPFPLRCLPLDDEVPSVSDLTLDLALLSIRHTEMDPVVDGAWLRNSEVSRPRPAALTDDFVFTTSCEQLLYLTSQGTSSLLLRIYQTGLDAAIVGFYRAVARHLLSFPRSLVVVPMFHARAGEGEATYLPGDPWRVKA